MSFNDVLAKVEMDTEAMQMNLAVHKQNMNKTKMDRYEELAFLHGVKRVELPDSNVQTVIDISLISKDRDRLIIHTNQVESFFADCKGKMVYLSGLMKSDLIVPLLYVSSCYPIDERDNVLNNCEGMSEQEKRAFFKKIREFSPELQRDLTEKRVALVGRKHETNQEIPPATYIDLEEMDALYDVLEPMIPIEFRTEYSNCKRMLKKPGSNSEKRNYIKVINNILAIDWENQYYKDIDVDTAIKKLRLNHVGHEAQIEELRTQLLTCNLTKKAPKALSFVGRSCGCGSMAVELAKAIGRKYVEIDFSGRNTKDSDTLTGSSRIYENGKCGLIFEKLQEVGPYGCLIIKNIDTYDSITLDIITSLIKKDVYTDNFMEIPMDLSRNLWVITTASSTKNIPMSLRKATHEILFEKMTELERIEAINKVILPQKCEEYGIVCDTAIPADTCKALIYQISHNENKKIMMNIEALVVKVLAEGKKEFPVIDKALLKQYFRYDDDIERIRGEYVTDLAAMENKFYHLYDYYPTSVRDRVSELLEDIRYSDDDKLEAYSIHALRYLVNPTNGTPFEYEIGAFENEIKKMRSGQDSVIRQVDDALLAEMLSGNNKRMTVLGLWGPPGVGKTSIAEIIAKALKRKLIKISFGGAHDSSIIKGKNKVVQNAGPSLLLSELARKCGTYHDVINIDEVDKGSPESYEALHEFLDPATECYFEEFPETNIPKNNFLVILTFNDITKIPNPILDRMRLIKVDGYTISEKSEIARNSIIKKYEHSMGLKNVSITDDALSLLMQGYSVAPGVRDLEMDIEKLIVRIYKRDHSVENIQITEKDVRDALGSKRTLGMNDMGNKTAIPGQAIALAVAGNIGSCIAIQCVEDPYQTCDLEVSGLMKGSCLESLSDAMSYARRTLKMELPKLHISFRDPAAPKDGGSAGVTHFMAIMSCLLKKGLEDCCFTGSIDLYGNVGAVAVNEKITAAEREGIKSVYIPQDNYDQLKENHMLEKYSKIEIIPVKHVSELTKKFFGLEVK